MSTISTGTNSGDGQTPREVDALNANRRDSDRGLAGPEAKPFAETAKDPKTQSETAEEDGGQARASLVSARRNPGRD